MARIESIKLFEHSKVKLADLNIPLSIKEVDEFQKLNDDIRTRNRQSTDVLKFGYKQSKPTTLQTYSHVGVLQIGNKVIQVVPKLAKNGTTTATATSIKNLLFMLEYTQKIRTGSVSSAELLADKSDFYEILIYLYASNLLSILKNEIYSEYAPEEDNLSYIKGKINFGSHVRLNAITRHRFYVEYDEYNENNTLNQVFKLVTQLLLKVSKSYHNIKLLQELSHIFSNVELRHVSYDEANKLKLNRMSMKYREPYNLCLLFLGNSSIQLSSGNIMSYSFLIDMNVLFEEFVAELLKRRLRDTNYIVTAQRPIKPFVIRKLSGDTEHLNLFMLRPDIVIKLGDEVVMIVDTKYKILDGDSVKMGIKQPDLYQLYAYSKKYECGNVALLYPQLPDQTYQDTEYEIDTISSVRVATIDLCVDLKREIDSVADTLIERLHITAQESHPTKRKTLNNMSIKTSGTG